MAVEVDPHHEDDPETALARRLNVIFEFNEYETHRYVPQAIGEGPGWEVWDQKAKRALSEDEVRVLTFEDVCESYVN